MTSPKIPLISSYNLELHWTSETLLSFRSLSRDNKMLSTNALCKGTMTLYLSEPYFALINLAEKISHLLRLSVNAGILPPRLGALALSRNGRLD